MSRRRWRPCQETTFLETDMGTPRGPKELSLAQQFLFLKNSKLTPGSGTLTHVKLSWTYDVQPVPLSRRYQVRIDLPRSGAPNVFVVNPNIEVLAGGRNIPHVYRNPLRLCLHMPKTGQWTPAKRLDNTIVPWTALWLFYFEDWLASDDWKGEGIHPEC